MTAGPTGEPINEVVTAVLRLTGEWPGGQDARKSPSFS
jgi:hypothetical protein